MSPRTACRDRGLVQPVNRHHGKELLDGPGIGNRLEEGEVAEVGVRQRVVEPLQVLGHLVHLLDELPQLGADRPVQRLGLAALLERQVAGVEQVQRHVERLLGVVEALERVAGVEAVVRLLQIDQRLLELLAVAILGDLALVEAGDAQHVEHEHAVVGDDGAPALGDDRRVLDAGVVAHGLDVVDDVVGVLLERVVDAGLEVGLRPVVVDPEAAAHVQVLEAGAVLHELRVDARGLVQRALHDADVRNLAAEMEVQELEAVLHAVRFELGQALPDFRHGQAELRSIPARGLPPPAATRRELHAHADLRPDAHLARVFENQAELGVLLDHRDDPPAHLERQHRHLDELRVLEAVADDGRLVGRHGDHGQQLRLRPGLEPEVVRASEVQHLLDHLALLVDLDRIDAEVPALGTDAVRWPTERPRGCRRAAGGGCHGTGSGWAGRCRGAAGGRRAASGRWPARDPSCRAPARDRSNRPRSSPSPTARLSYSSDASETVQGSPCRHARGTRLVVVTAQHHKTTADDTRGFFRPPREKEASRDDVCPWPARLSAASAGGGAIGPAASCGAQNVVPMPNVTRVPAPRPCATATSTRRTAAVSQTPAPAPIRTGWSARRWPSS